VLRTTGYNQRHRPARHMTIIGVELLVKSFSYTALAAKIRAML
jgi:hypothetical protein